MAECQSLVDISEICVPNLPLSISADRWVPILLASLVLWILAHASTHCACLGPCS